MYKFPIGVILESFRCERSEAIKKAAALGANGIQMYATKGANSAENLTATDRKELLKEVRDNGLVFSALCGDLGEGLFRPERNPQLIERSKRIIDLAKDLETNIVTTHIGVVPEDPNHDRYKIMQEACFELSRYADSLNAHFAIETGPERAATLKNFLDGLGSKGVAVNFDPANLIMGFECDPAEEARILKDYIVHTHAKDGIMYKQIPAEIEYGIITPRPDEYKNIDEFYKELPLGDGVVDFPNYLKALEEIGYKGFLTIEREVGAEPHKDIKKAFDFLNTIIKEN